MAETEVELWRKENEVLNRILNLQRCKRVSPFKIVQKPFSPLTWHIYLKR